MTIEKLMHDAGIGSIRELAETAGLPYNSVHRFVSGKASLLNLPVSTCRRLACALGLSLEELLHTEISGADWSALRDADGWVEVKPSLSVLVEDGRVVRGVYGSDLSQKPVYPYEVSPEGGYDSLIRPSVEDFIELAEAGQADFF